MDRLSYCFLLSRFLLSLTTMSIPLTSVACDHEQKHDDMQVSVRCFNNDGLRLLKDISDVSFL